jgi:hypothetical protein
MTLQCKSQMRVGSRECSESGFGWRLRSVMHVQGLYDFSTRWQDIDKTQCDERDVWMGSFV